MFLLSEVLSPLGWRCVHPQLSQTISGVAIDSRKIERGNLFVAIRTDRDDGHRFLKSAFEKGASGAIIDEHFYENHRDDLSSSAGFFNIIPVQDTVQALTNAAVFLRKRFHPKIIAITGSVGKSTTKDFLSFLLANAGPTLSNHGNLNNHLGLPITLLGLESKHQYCVAEMGASQKDDIRYLVDMLEPDIGILTQVSPAHLKGFGRLGEIYEAKCELFKGLPSGATVILPENDQFLIQRAEKKNLNIKTVGYTSQSDYAIDQINIQNGWITFRLNQRDFFSFQGVAPFLCKNAAMAIAAFEACGISRDKLPRKWEGAKTPKGRFQEFVFEHGIHLIDDSYNASPLSFTRALETFAHMPSQGGRKILVFSDMLEMGSEEKKYHEDLGRLILRCEFDLVLAYGRLSRLAIDVIEKSSKNTHLNIFFFENLEQIADYLCKNIRPKDFVLFKASRGMQIDKVFKSVEESLRLPMHTV